MRPAQGLWRVDRPEAVDQIPAMAQEGHGRSELPRGTFFLQTLREGLNNPGLRPVHWLKPIDSHGRHSLASVDDQCGQDLVLFRKYLHQELGRIRYRVSDPESTCDLLHQLTPCVGDSRAGPLLMGWSIA